MTFLSKFESRKLTRSEKESVSGGASEGRCQAMIERFVSEGGDKESRLWARILKNCEVHR